MRVPPSSRRWACSTSSIRWPRSTRRSAPARSGLPSSRSGSPCSRRPASGCSCTGWSTLRLRDLEAGAKRLAAGNLEEPIPVRSDDEFGQVAASFNVMTTALRETESALRESAHNLERKVEERTEQLRAAEAEAAPAREARRGGVARLRRRARDQQSADRRADVLAPHPAEDGGRFARRRGHGPRHPRDQALRRHRPPPARLRPPEGAGSELHRPQRGDRRRRPVHRALGAPARHGDRRSTSIRSCRASGSTRTR